MNFAQVTDSIISLFFPARSESFFFKNWPADTYRKNLRPSLTNNDKIHSLFSYKDPNVRKLIRSIKKEKVYYIGDALSEILAEEILSLFEDSTFVSTEKIYIVPIPISKRRFRERGFNQSSWITKLATRHLDDSFVFAPYMLKKIKDTKKQALLKRRERLDNPRGSFQAQNIPKNARIILFDDVITTGATISEAQKVLQKAGAKHIDMFCIAQ